MTVEFTFNGLSKEEVEDFLDEAGVSDYSWEDDTRLIISMDDMTDFMLVIEGEEGKFDWHINHDD